MEANDKARLLREIQLCTFLLTEANLYLDTHPDDQDALKFYEKHAARLLSVGSEVQILSWTPANNAASLYS